MPEYEYEHLKGVFVYLKKVSYDIGVNKLMGYERNQYKALLSNWHH